MAQIAAGPRAAARRHRRPALPAAEPARPAARAHRPEPEPARPRASTRTRPASSGRTTSWRSSAGAAITVVDGAALRDRRLGGPRPSAADDQRRRAPLAAGGLPLRPPPPRARRDRPALHALARRRGRLELAPTGRARAGRRARRRRPSGRGPRRRPSTASPRADAASRAAPRAGRARRRRRAGGRGPQPTLRILETRVLRGPNYWAREPVIRHARRPRRPRGVPDRTRSRASSTRSSRCCPRSRTTPARSAAAAASSPACARGRGSGHVAEHIALELQNLAGTDVRHGKTRSRRRVRPLQRASSSTARSRSGIEAGRIAVALVNHLVAPDDPAVAFDFAPELERLIRLAERLAFGPSTQALIDEAVSRDIPYIRLDRHTSSSSARASTSSGSGRR